MRFSTCVILLSIVVCALLNLSEANIAIGRTGSKDIGRPGKRSLVLGRPSFRPGKRSLAVGRGKYRPGKRNFADALLCGPRIADTQQHIAELLSELQIYQQYLASCYSSDSYFERR